MSLDEVAEAPRAKNVGEQSGAVAPALVDYTTDYLFRDLWPHRGLAPRDLRLLGLVLREAPVSKVADTILPYTIGGFIAMIVTGLESPSATEKRPVIAVPSPAEKRAVDQNPVQLPFVTRRPTASKSRGSERAGARTVADLPKSAWE